ncbi:MAG: tRNA (5-methylaminomethyl-2-thiouridine)(34)-methyltransferase MnmD [Saprospiraceae bacterium]|nr:tRNA (5-methylaminomethyl-2-thiouridine)(34)-methyltransferase MnmD [Saprospiraceae bacterium]
MADDASRPQRKQTRDGSDTLYSARFEQHYHNPNGAVAESKHNFFETNGLYPALGKLDTITVLEVGFGTGLNLMLLLDAWLELDEKPDITFLSIEAYPVDEKTARSTNYGRFMNHPVSAEKTWEIFPNLKPGLNSFDLYPQFEAIIFCGLFNNLPSIDLQADFIFHDPFSPDVNQELWTVDTFQKLKELSSGSVVLSTYSAASAAKAAMAVAGWKVARAPGALGKREMTVAALDEGKLNGFERVNEKRLIDRYRAGDFE